MKQECIPVGCVPAGHWPNPRGGACFLGCVLPGGWCVLRGGVCFPGGCASGGVPASRGWYPSMHWGRPPPPVNRITDTSKNITLATTSLRLVIIKCECSTIVALWGEHSWPKFLRPHHPWMRKVHILLHIWVSPPPHGIPTTDHAFIEWQKYYS